MKPSSVIFNGLSMIILLMTSSTVASPSLSSGNYKIFKSTLIPRNTFYGKVGWPFTQYTKTSPHIFSFPDLNHFSSSHLYKRDYSKSRCYKQNRIILANTGYSIPGVNTTVSTTTTITYNSAITTTTTRPAITTTTIRAQPTPNSYSLTLANGCSETDPRAMLGSGETIESILEAHNGRK